MTLRYRITAEDFVEAQRAHRSTRPVDRAVFLFLTAIFSLMLVLSLVLLVVRPTGIAYSWYHPLLAGIFLFFLRSNFLVRRQFSRIVALQKEFEAEIEDDGISISTASANSRIRWDAFEGWHESKQLFLVYQQPRMFNLFPKRAFAPGEADRFRELLMSRLPKR